MTYSTYDAQRERYTERWTGPVENAVPVATTSPLSQGLNKRLREAIAELEAAERRYNELAGNS